jgi:hypothetical protein
MAELPARRTHAAHVDDVEVDGSHLGMGWNPDVAAAWSA